MQGWECGKYIHTQKKSSYSVKLCGRKIEKWKGLSSILSGTCRHNHPSFLKYENEIFLMCVRSERSAKMSCPSLHTAPISPTAVVVGFPDLDDSMTRSAGRWSPFAALTTSPTATWYYQPNTSRGRERVSVAVDRTGRRGKKEGWRR